MRQKLERLEELESKNTYEYWSLKRILVGFFIAFLLFGIGGIYIWETLLKDPFYKIKNVLGISTEEIPKKEIVIPDREDAERILKNAQKELLQIAPDNLVSSQAAIQKIINDLEKLQKGQKDIKGYVCKYVCD